MSSLYNIDCINQLLPDLIVMFIFTCSIFFSFTMRQSVIILLLFFTVYSFCASLRNECEDICETQQCVETSAIVLKNMDSSVAPCDNFYKFACGNYVKKTVIPEDKSTISTYAFVRDIVATQLYSIFEDEEIGNDLEIFRKVKEYYTLCMDLGKL